MKQEKHQSSKQRTEECLFFLALFVLVFVHFAEQATAALVVVFGAHELQIITLPHDTHEHSDEMSEGVAQNPHCTYAKRFVQVPGGAVFGDDHVINGARDPRPVITADRVLVLAVAPRATHAHPRLLLACTPPITLE
jgi:hypothetical protein